MKTFGYTCQRCGTVVGKTRRDGTHVTYEEHLAACFSGTAGVDYVECKLCKFAGNKITQHVKNIHGISKKEYEASFGSTLASASAKRYGSTGNGDWIRKANEDGRDLAEYKKKIGTAVSAAIISNPEERARRAELLGQLNKREDFRQRSSKAAKITSARAEILAQRTENLRKWRSENFEDFYEKCIKAMNETWQSRPERKLFEFVKNFDISFKRNQRLFDSDFSCKSKRKQIDMMNDHVLIEFDRIYHFKRIKEDIDLAEIKRNDSQLNSVVLKRNLTLIRISYDQFSYKCGGHFSESCIKHLCEILNDPKPGVFFIGEAYENIMKENEIG